MAEVSAAQIRAGRALLEWSQSDLAQRSGVSLSTIRRMEAREGLVRRITDNVWKVQAALESAGVEFINGDSPGVRMKSGRFSIA